MITAPNSAAPSLSEAPVVVTSTSYSIPTTTGAEPSRATSGASSSSSQPASLQPDGPGNNSSSGGIKNGGKIAVAVVVPVVVVALLVLGAIFWWRRRKQRKTTEEARRKEVEEYGYNPNNDPTLPAVGGTHGSDSPEMTEDSGGYRGWGNTNPGSNRKPSTNLSSGIGQAISDDGNHNSPGSPGHTVSDGGHSGDPLMNSAGAAGGATTVTGAAGATNSTGRTDGAEPGMKRGPSNASSSYSAAGQTDDSDDARGPEHTYDTNYSQYAPYRPGVNGFENAYDDGGSQPVIRDVSARRNTKIENPKALPTPGSSGIAANF